MSVVGILGLHDGHKVEMGGWGVACAGGVACTGEGGDVYPLFKWLYVSFYVSGKLCIVTKNEITSQFVLQFRSIHRSLCG